MYDNIGGKIKMLAKVTTIVLAILFIVLGTITMAMGDIGVIIGLLILIVGVLLSWISSWVLYGFGEIIEKVAEIEKNTCKDEAKLKTRSKEEDERIEKIERLRKKGLITEEEYQQAISKE